MPNTFNENTFSTTYKDDYKDSDNYHRILFNSARALQARELTQMQTIIQKELARFGRNIFKEGAVVNPGGLDVNSEYEFVKLQVTTGLVLYTGDILTASTNGVKAEVIEFVAQDGGDPPTAYIKYIDEGSAATGTTPIRFSAAQVLTNGNESGLGGTSSVTVATTASNPVVGQGFSINVNLGSYFVRDHFVQTLPQSKIISKYSNTPTVNIGFKVTEDIVTVADTDALYDNQLGTPNETAPGADRYRITLTLETEDNVDSDENFVITNRFVNGVLQQEIDENTYNIIGDEMALRTKEESGSYTVENFEIKFKEATSTTLTLDVSPGIAYVNGYRVAKPAPTPITVNRSQATETKNNENIAASFGNFVRVTGDNLGVPNINDFEVYNLFDDSAGSFTTEGVDEANQIGTAKVRSFEQEGTNYRYYLFDINMNAGENFRNVRSLGLDSFNAGTLILENNIAVIKDATNNNLFFDLPRTKPASISDIVLTVQRRFQDTAAGGSITLSLTGTETFVDTGLWIVARTDTGAIVTPTITGSGTASVTLSGLANVQHEIIGYVSRGANATHRSKTLSLDSEHTGVLESDGTGVRFVRLPDTDIFEFKNILDLDSVDISNNVRTDNGQRDNFYDKGKVYLLGGRSLPKDETIRVVYNHFEHGATGDFFSRNSYIGQVDYEDIPSHRLKNGFTVDLRDVLDFRSVFDSADAGGNNPTYALKHALPRNTDVVTADIEYYQPRKDVLVVTEEGDLSYIEGQPNVRPSKPLVPSNSMELYNFEINPYTDNEDDLSIASIDNRRYTMRDIGDIVKRIDNLEEVTTLNLLELETSTLEVLDSNGNSRFKNGFFADNFKDLAFADIFSPEYSASHNAQERTIMPLVGQKNIRLIYDSDNSTTLRKGDLVYLNYSEVIEITQDLATETENVNPFDVIIYNGDLELSPSVDQWREDIIDDIVSIRPIIPTPRQRRNRARTITRPVRIGNNNVLNFPEAQNNLSTIDDLAPETIGQFIDDPDRVLSRRTFRRNFVETTVTRTLIGRRVVDISLLPFIRHRKVFFRATQLAPQRTHFLFFDGESMADYVRSDTFERFGEGNGLASYTDGQYKANTSHPQGSSALKSDDNGTIEGSFFIPNNNTLRFDAGARVVKLLDISVDDDAAALSGAAATYEAEGVRVTYENVISTTSRSVNLPRPRPRPPRRNKPLREPIAQSFQIQNANGSFLTGIDVYFATKPDGTNDKTPIRLEVRPVRNGVPSQDEIIPGSVVILNHDDITNVVSEATAVAAGDGGIDLIRAAPTKFTFEQPIYIPGFEEHAFVLIANTQAYNVWVAEIEDFIVGSTSRRVRKQPSTGSFFMSQNAITWTPDQRRDMMFRVHRADFVTSGNALLENDAVPTTLLNSDPISFDSGTTTATVSLLNHGFTINDKVEITGLDSATTYGGVLGASIMGERSITKVDAFGYQFTMDSEATTSSPVGGSVVISEQQAPIDEALPVLDVFALEATRATFSASFTDFVSLVTANDATNTAYGTFGSIELIPNETVVFESPRVIASERVEGDEATLGGAITPRKSLEVTGTMSTTDTYVSPVLDLQTASLTTVNNIIDNPADSAGADGINVTVNNPISYVEETDPASGSVASKHLTNAITLSEAAVGLKVLIGANVPSGSFIDVYYRTVPAGEDLDINDINYVEATIDNEVPTEDNPSVFRELKWTIGGIGGNLTPFTTFQLKIVFRSQNSSRVPRIRDLRAIALGT